MRVTAPAKYFSLGFNFDPIESAYAQKGKHTLLKNSRINYIAIKTHPQFFKQCYKNRWVFQGKLIDIHRFNPVCMLLLLLQMKSSLKVFPHIHYHIHSLQDSQMDFPPD